MNIGKWPTRECWQLTTNCYLRFTLKKAMKISDIYQSDQMILSQTPKCYTCFVYDRLSKNRFQEKSSKGMKDDNYTKYSRGLSELHERALLVNKFKLLIPVWFERKHNEDNVRNCGKAYNRKSS